MGENEEEQEEKIELTVEQAAQAGEYMSAFDVLVGDERTKRTLIGVIILFEEWIRPWAYLLFIRMAL